LIDADLTDTAATELRKQIAVEIAPVRLTRSLGDPELVVPPLGNLSERPQLVSPLAQ
jgi:hypothetical protein